MQPLSLFLSVVLVVRNQQEHLRSLLDEATAAIGALVTDYELIVVDNASGDGSLALLKSMVGVGGVPNTQVYALTKEVDRDTASWVGLENALGDYVAVIDPVVDNISFLPTLLDKAVRGADVVFARNERQPAQSMAYTMTYAVLSWLYRTFTGVHLAKQAPPFRLLSKSVVNFILRHPQPSVTYRLLPATGGFVKSHLTYNAVPRVRESRRLGGSVDRGVRLLVSTTRTPMRLVTSLSLFGAVANVLYSIYVVAVGLLKADVAQGWVSLSLQQSGMFFLISLVLLVLGEYMLNMVSLTNEGPAYHVGQEFTSARMIRREKLNVEDVQMAAMPSINTDVKAGPIR